MAGQSVRNTVERGIPKEARFCEDIINQHTESRVRFNSSPDRAGSFILYHEDGPSFMVHPSHGQNDKPAVLLSNHYLFQCDISFQPGKNKNTFIFDGISLQFYDFKGLLFRAEWDNNNDTVHPQPHWHFGDKTLFKDRDLSRSLSGGFMNIGSSFLPDFSSPVYLDYERLHFAMCMNLNDKGISAVYSEKYLKGWIESCLQLFDDQIKILSGLK